MADLSTGDERLRLTPEAVVAMRERLPGVAEETVEAIIAAVPSYENALHGEMGRNIRGAVQLALGGFLSLAERRRVSDPGTPTAPAVDGAYQLGRGEARSGRTTEALLAAYRIGARVSWRDLSATAVRHGVSADQLAGFAELVFAYIDELSDASVAGHADELATTGRVRARLLERLVRALVDGAPADAAKAAAERVGWEPPRTLTAVLVPASQVRPVLAGLAPATLQLDLDDVDRVLLLVPDAHGRRRTPLLRVLADRGAVVGPPRPWLEVATSYQRARRALALDLTGDTDDHLATLVLTADADALADLRTRALAPLEGQRPATVEKLTETLRAWLLHHGRREDVAEALFVHPQTVRYRMGRLRELYADRLEDPQTVLELTVALGVTPAEADPSGAGAPSSGASPGGPDAAPAPAAPARRPAAAR